MSRWKLTDDPPPSKKKPPSLEDTTRQDGHKRKKEKDLPQENASKKKVGLIALLHSQCTSHGNFVISYIKSSSCKEHCVKI